MDSQVALDWVQRIACFGIALGCAEWLARPNGMSDTSLMSWEVARLRHRLFTFGWLADLLDLIFAHPRVRLLHATRLVLSLLGMVVVDGPWQLLVLGSLAFLSMVFLARQAFGFDGSDQALNISLLVLFLVAVIPGRVSEGAALWFLAAQLCLSYVTAGILKSKNPEWRDGRALVGVLDTHMYGNPSLAVRVRPHAGLVRMMGSGIVLWECSFPSVLVLPPAFLPLFVVTGIGFHIANALIMGLNSFVYAFAAWYPALVWVVLVGRGF